ncbi:MAG: NTP transferase domain-containing protein, partial [Deltaproteobacteria bacterium]|nr:NTP transferase domain-containing protein [Deltaproteobacteria bacterium]
MIRQALILAAGQGTRLRASADDLPKPLQLVGRVPLLERTARALVGAGVTRIVVVTGFRAELVRDAAHALRDLAEIELVHNPDFELANGVSVAVGGRALTGPFLLSMVDHVYGPEIPRALAVQDLTAADLYLATDPRIDEVRDLDDATKVRTDGGRIVDIGKAIAAYDRIDCGVFAAGAALLDCLDELRAARGDCSLSDGVRRLAARGRARAVDIGDAFWQDVDTPADREHAERALAHP